MDCELQNEDSDPSVEVVDITPLLASSASAATSSDESGASPVPLWKPSRFISSFGTASVEDVDITPLLAHAVPVATSSDDSGTPPVSIWKPAKHHKEKMTEPDKPPSYEVATTLPTYEEAERTKEEDKLLEEENRDDNEHRGQVINEIDRLTDWQLGNDGIFLCMFLIAFVFNWFGLAVALCMTHTVAGRFGAIAGFGLSLIKWVAIFKYNSWTGDVEDPWLWWCLIIIGFLIFFRGCTQYLSVKYEWARFNTQVQQRMYLFF